MDDQMSAAIQTPEPTQLDTVAELEPLTVPDLLLAGPMAPVANPYPIYSRARRDAPVVAIFSGSAYFVSRYDDVAEVLRDHERFSNRSNMERGIGIVIGRTLIGMDGREHLTHRALITPSLAPRSLRGEFPGIVASIAETVIG